MLPEKLKHIGIFLQKDITLVNLNHFEYFVQLNVSMVDLVLQLNVKATNGATLEIFQHFYLVLFNF